MALVISILFELEFYERAATVLLKIKRYDKASALFRRSLNYKESRCAYKWIGQVALRNKDFDEAILNLNKADLNDEQVLFNLTRSYFFNNQIDKAKNYHERLKKISPG
ncbi:MAG: hypothetical protein PVH88_05680 [Ignavibacteria bacterium]|jgi:tetratricopeptide (TPR) repeat protein